MKPSVKISFRRGGLAQVTNATGKTQVKIGVALLGDVNTVITCPPGTTALRLLKGGPLCEAVSNQASRSGATVLAVNVPITTLGAVGAFTQAGTGAGAVSATPGPVDAILVKCTKAGAVGTAEFQFSVDGGAYGASVKSSGTTWVYRVPGTFTELTFAPGSYRLNDVYTIATAGTVSASSPAGGPDTISQASSPVDAYRLVVTIVKAGARGTAQFTVSRDNGANTSRAYTTAATFVVPDSGIVLAFTDAAYVAGDVYTATTTPPAFTSADAQTAVGAALQNAIPFEGIHIVGTPATAAAAVTLATMLDTELQSAEEEVGSYVWGVVECPSTEADATVQSAVANFESVTGHVSIAIGDGDYTSKLTALVFKRNAAWPYCTRLASTKYSRHPGAVEDGALPGVSAIYDAASGTPTADVFDDSRFVTLRTVQGEVGYYVCRGNTMDDVTADTNEMQRVRVIYAVARIIQKGLTQWLNSDWRIDPETGHLDDRDLGLLESALENAVKAELMGQRGSSKDEISDVSVLLDPEANLLSSSTLPADVAIVPKAYAEQLEATLGFVNPLAAA
jgi:hypothetical protein